MYFHPLNLYPGKLLVLGAVDVIMTSFSCLAYNKVADLAFLGLRTALKLGMLIGGAGVRHCLTIMVVGRFGS